MNIVYKPWGKEEWLELNDRYCYKRIYINAGHRTSFQYHNFKRETNYLIAGTAEIWLENDEGVVDKFIMNAGEFFNVTPPKKHRVIALTDIILQEVSTPEVDDVIRLEDDTNREDGRLEHEHQPPAVLILAAGKGTRLGKLTTHVNKGLVPLNNKAVISHLIEKFPKDYELVIATGYKEDSLVDYLSLAHSDRNMTFVNIPDWESADSGPGVSALACKQYLQRPFYWVTVDCLFEGNAPSLDGNWLGLHRTAFPEKYSTAQLDSLNNITGFKNKTSDGYENGFIGLASIFDYDIFWKELEEKIVCGEIVCAFENPKAYPVFQGRLLNWHDMGNLDDIERAKEFYKDDPISLYKDTGETTYHVGDKFIKFFTDRELAERKAIRASKLGELIPSGFQSRGNFYSYDWLEGKTAYLSPNRWNLFLLRLHNTIENSYKYHNYDAIEKFYLGKTKSRLDLFKSKYGQDLFTESYIINGETCHPLDNLWMGVFTILRDTPLYDKFHGDLQFDNIICGEDNQDYYIDWRDSFADSTQGGDVYYDLAKLYGGLLMNYNSAKDDNSFSLTVVGNKVTLDANISKELKSFLYEYEAWLKAKGYDVEYVKVITSLIFLSMSPLHSDKFNKFVFFYGLKLLNDFHDY